MPKPLAIRIITLSQSLESCLGSGFWWVFLYFLWLFFGRELINFTKISSSCCSSSPSSPWSTPARWSLRRRRNPRSPHRSTKSIPISGSGNTLKSGTSRWRCPWSMRNSRCLSRSRSRWGVFGIVSCVSGADFCFNFFAGILLRFSLISYLI